MATLTNWKRARKLLKAFGMDISQDSKDKLKDMGVEWDKIGDNNGKETKL